MRILLVDDHPLFLEGLSSLLRAQPDLEVAGIASQVSTAIALAIRLKPDVILMDFSLPDGTGLEAAQAILAQDPAARIIFLTVHEDDERLFAALRAGAKGFLPKHIDMVGLLTALQNVARGEPALTARATGRVIDLFTRLAPQPQPAAASADLTTREQEVFTKLASGASNREIAEELVIAESTVKIHVRRILSKLNFHNRREAAAYARDYHTPPGLQ
jgi:two-component system, NarL family, nitrate/nitrite response regulator NarL